VGEW
jgi:hypothetical protein